MILAQLLASKGTRSKQRSSEATWARFLRLKLIFKKVITILKVCSSSEVAEVGE
jgi:hypothetical protein